MRKSHLRPGGTWLVALQKRSHTLRLRLLESDAQIDSFQSLCVRPSCAHHATHPWPKEGCIFAAVLWVAKPFAHLRQHRSKRESKDVGMTFQKLVIVRCDCLERQLA